MAVTDPITPASATHFGLKVRKGPKYGLRIERSTYATINKRSSFYVPREDVSQAMWDLNSEFYEDEDHRILTDEYCLAHQEKVLANFDLNMQYFERLNRDEFATAVDVAIASIPQVVEVHDLNEWERKGLYVMVLGDYCQAYVGVTDAPSGIKGRIRKHWSTSKEFDRLIFGTVETSILSIDSFRALDTTRIFAAQVRNPDKLEDTIIRAFPEKFLLNRLRGGYEAEVITAIESGENVFKQRDLRGPV